MLSKAEVFKNVSKISSRVAKVCKTCKQDVSVCEFCNLCERCCLAHFEFFSEVFEIMLGTKYNRFGKK